MYKLPLNIVQRVRKAIDYSRTHNPYSLPFRGSRIQTDKMAVNEEHEQKMRELQRSYVDFLDDSDR